MVYIGLTILDVQYYVMRIFLLLIIFPSLSSLIAQNNSPKEVIHTFFQAMYGGDSTTLDAIVADDILMKSSYLKEGSGSIKAGSKLNFLNAVAKASKGSLDERICDLIVEERAGLANVWMEYAFYLNGQFSHCGVNNFTMAKEGKQWKIVSVVDTREKSNCKIEEVRLEIDTFLSHWHLAASQADSLSFFSKMSKDAIYAGTDASEVWSKRSFLEFAAPYFKRGKAWDFKRISRNIYSDDYESTIWFDELLETWMGPCRGSGIIVKEGQDWKIKHYVLSVTVPNDDIQEFIDLSNKSK